MISYIVIYNMLYDYILEYLNESIQCSTCRPGPGRAIQDSQVPREKLFIATKATSVALGMAEPS